MLYGIAGLTRLHGRKTVLSIPSLEIEEGCIHALLGPNGSGKTTLLNILGFLDAPTSGRIRFRGRGVVFAETELQALRRQVVVLDQHPILFTTTVYRNVEFGLRVRRLPFPERARIVEEALDLVGMRAFAAAPAHRLSGGETQRVALARALAVGPRVLLCDEPTASVDAENQEAVLRILQRINREQGLSIVFTTHDRLQAARLAQSTLHLDHGRLVSEAPENVFPAVVRGPEQGRALCLIENLAPLELAAESAAGAEERTGAVRVRIDPAGIRPAPLGAPAASANRLEGRVVRVVEEGGRVRIVVDAGVWIDILLEAGTYRKNPPPVGATMGILIPPEAIRLL